MGQTGTWRRGKRGENVPSLLSLSLAATVVLHCSITVANSVVLSSNAESERRAQTKEEGGQKGKLKVFESLRVALERRERPKGVDRRCGRREEASREGKRGRKLREELGQESKVEWWVGLVWHERLCSPTVFSLSRVVCCVPQCRW